MSNIASNTLKNKIKRLLVKNSLGSSSTSRFVVASNISIETKDVLSTAPVKHVYVLNVNLYIGDGIDGTLFATSTVRLKGVGESETKAYNAAFNNFNVNSTNLEEFISEGKNKIIEYYNAKCDILISEAQSLAKSGQFDLSLYKLSLIPDVCLECFNKTQPVIVEVYNMKINSECNSLC